MSASPIPVDDIRIIELTLKQPDERDGQVVEYNVILSLVLCIESVQFLGTALDRKSTQFYPTKCLGKDSGKLGEILPVLVASRMRASRLPSTAKDSGAELRIAKLVEQKPLNLLGGL